MPDPRWNGITGLERGGEAEALGVGLEEAAGLRCEIVPGALQDAVEIPAARTEVGPVAADRVAVELVAAAPNAKIWETVLDVAVAMADGEIDAAMVTRAVLVLATIDVETRLEGKEVVVEGRSAAEDAVAVALAVMAKDAAPDAIGVALAEIGPAAQLFLLAHALMQGVDDARPVEGRHRMAPAEILDYVVEHEVAHLSVHDHSPRFWKLLASRDPEWREREAWLRRHGHSLRF